MHRMKNKALNSLLATVLIVVTVVSSVITSNIIDYCNGAAMIGSVFVAPGAAFDATEKFIEEKPLNNIQTAPQVQIEDTDTGKVTESEQAALPETAQQKEETAQQEIAATENTADASIAQDASAQQNDEQQQGAQPLDEPMPEGAVPIVSAFYEQGTGATYIQTGTGSIRNLTSLSQQEVAQQVGQPLPFTVELNSDLPQVLIMHTHATESFEIENKTWTDPEFTARSTDNTLNITSVGADITQRLNEAGINTLHDTTLHDYPSYNGSYDRSYVTVQNYLTQYPSIKVVIDVHRDAIQKEDGTRVKPVAQIDGQQAAQVMLIACADKDGNIPNYKENLKFAANFEAKMEELYPGLTRPVLFDYRYYNQDLTTGSLLLEVGGHANTLEEAMYTAELVSNSLIALFSGG